MILKASLSRHLKPFIFCLGIALSLLSSDAVPAAHAGILTEIRQNISSLWGQQRGKRQEAREARSQASEVNQQARWVHEDLEQTQRLLQQANQTYFNYARQKKATEARLVKTRNRVQMAAKKYAHHKRKFASRLGAMQRHGQPTYLQVVFGSQTLSDLTRRTAIYETLTQNDARLQAQIKADQRELQAAQSQLAAEWQERNRLHQAADRERGRIVRAEQKRLVQLRQLNASRAQLLAYANAQEQSSQELGSMIGELQARRSQIIADYEARAAAQRQAARSRRQTQSPEYAPRIGLQTEAPRYAPRVKVGHKDEHADHDHNAPPPMPVTGNRGSSGWVLPARGRLSSRYGMRRHPILGRRKLHTGSDIAAPSGTPIRAARSGRVLWSGWKKAYGNTIIVDHGGGVTTLYGHASKLGVQAGQPIRAGEYIGNVGSTGWSTGAHLHFEVRKNGRPVDPAPYLRKGARH